MSAPAPTRAPASPTALARAAAALACAAACAAALWPASAPASASGAAVRPARHGGGGTRGPAGHGAPASVRDNASATLQQCATATMPQTERAATFAGEMTAVPGTARMQMRIDVLERVPGRPRYRTVSAPGLGVWRSSAAGVKVFAYIKQVTNLSAPAYYRGEVRFRWLNARGHAIRSGTLRTARCKEPAPEAAASAR